MTLSDIQICGAVWAPRRSDAVFNSGVHTPLDAQAAANCRCVLRLSEDVIWQLRAEPHAAQSLLSITWQSPVIAEQVPCPLWEREPPDALCNAGVVKFTACNQAGIAALSSVGVICSPKRVMIRQMILIEQRLTHLRKYMLQIINRYNYLLFKCLLLADNLH